ncbi:MAG: S9 family peptidase [Thermomicrobiales bacterium]
MPDAARSPGDAPASPITPTRIVNDLPSLSFPRIAPGGPGLRIAWVRSQVNPDTHANESHLWLVDASPDAADPQPRQLTRSGARNSEPTWSPDGRQIAFVTARPGTDKPHAIAILPGDGTETRILTAHADPITGLAWSPDGTTIAYKVAVDPDNPNETPRDPDAPAPVRIVTRIDYKQDGVGFINEIRSQVFTVDVATGERRQRTHGREHMLRPTWSPDGATIAAVISVQSGFRSRIAMIDVASGAIAEQGPKDGAVGLMAWSPDGSSLLFDGAEPYSPQHEYFLLDLASGEHRAITSETEFLPDVGYQSGGPAGAPVWTDASTVLLHGLHKGGSGLWSLDLPTGALTQHAWWPQMHAGFSVAPDGKTVAQVVTALGGLTGITTIDVASGEQTLLFNELDAFTATTPFASWELLTLEREGFTIEAWLLKPPGFDETNTYPVILDVHGGPHNAYGYGINGLAQVFATNGYLVLLPNPRGSGTYGKAFAEAVVGDWGNEDWHDLEVMLDLVLERPYADASRTGIIGYSYGGYMVGWVLGHTDRFTAAICGAPVADFESTFGQSDIGHTRGTGEPPWEGRAYIEGRSPITHIHNATTPTLLLQGEADERCPVEQSEQLFISLKTIGVETEFVRYPGGSHLFINNGEPAHRIDYNTRCLAWFDRFLKPSANDPKE